MSCKERRHPHSLASSARSPGAQAGALAVGALALLLSACTQSTPEARGASRAAAAAAIPVITQPARIEPMGIEIEAVGTTQANESVEITSKASNTITAIRFQEGEEVERGAVLVEMDGLQAQGLARRSRSGARAQQESVRPQPRPAVAPGAVDGGPRAGRRVAEGRRGACRRGASAARRHRDPRVVRRAGPAFGTSASAAS